MAPITPSAGIKAGSGAQPGCVCVCVCAPYPHDVPLPAPYRDVTTLLPRGVPWGRLHPRAATALCAAPSALPSRSGMGRCSGGSRSPLVSRCRRAAPASPTRGSPCPWLRGQGALSPGLTASIRSAVPGGCAEPREGMRDEGCPRSRVRQRFAPLSPPLPFSWPRKQHWGGARVAARCAIVRAVGAQHEDGHRSTIPAGSGGAGQGFVLAVPTVRMGRSSSTPPRPYVCSNPAQHPWDSCNPHPNGDRALCLSSCSVPPPHPPQQGSPTVWRSQKAQHQLQSQSLFVGSPPPANQSVRRSPRSAGGRRTPHSHPTLSSAPLAEEPGPSPPQGMAPHINTDIQITKIALEYSQMNKNYSDMYSRARALCTQPGQPGGPGGLPGMRSCS